MGRPLSYSGKYTWIWEKYRPVILKLMMASSDSVQEYEFSSHEFKDSNNKKPTGYTFQLVAHKSRSKNDIKKNQLAQDPLSILRSSDTAEELMENSIYQFNMDKHFVLKVQQIPVTVEEAGSEEVDSEEGEAKDTL